MSWRAWVLLGEPVFNSTARWNLEKVTIHDSESDLSATITDRELLKEVDLIDVGLRTYVNEVRTGKNFQGEDGSPPLLIVDPGVMMPPGLGGGSKGINWSEKSYNVPGSPDWGDTFVRYSNEFSPSPTAALDMIAYISKSLAKAIYRKGFTLECAKYPAYFSANVWPLIFDLERKDRIAKNKQLEDQYRKKKETLLSQQQTKKQQLKRSGNTEKRGDADDFLAELDQELGAIDLDLEYQARIKELDAAYDEELKRIESRYSLASIKAGEDEVEQRLAAKRKEIDGMSLPGEKLEKFSEGRKCGYKYSNGRIAIPAQHDLCGNFEDTKPPVAIIENFNYNKACGDMDYFNDKFVINSSGKAISPLAKNIWLKNDGFWVVIYKNISTPEKIYANDRKNNLRNEYLKWEYQYNIEFEKAFYSLNGDLKSSEIIRSRDRGEFSWQKKCFGIKEHDSSD